jgi:hypothetical protein
MGSTQSSASQACVAEDGVAPGGAALSALREVAAGGAARGSGLAHGADDRALRAHGGPADDTLDGFYVDAPHRGVVRPSPRADEAQEVSKISARSGARSRRIILGGFSDI